VSSLRGAVHFANTCEYIKGLWSDEGNPLFRQWMSKNDMKALLVAALLHDIGHFPLCHDIEETQSRSNLFDHIDLAKRFLDSSLKDTNGRTLKELIMDEFDGWGADLNFVKEIITATKQREKIGDIFDESANSKARFLATILSSDIDADKLDYLIRDSRGCQLLYGESIDVSRLIRTLTTAIFYRADEQDPNDPERTTRTLDIAIYEKGKAAAESIGFARYLLFQAVYWHHASRAIKAMINEAVQHLSLNGDPKKRKGFEESFYRFLGLLDAGKAKDPRDIAIDRYQVLSFLSDKGDNVTKEIISLIKDRRLFKRILTIHRKTDIKHGEANYYDLIAKNSTKIKLLLRNNLIESFIKKRESQIETLSAPNNAEAKKVIELLNSDYGILIDIPMTKYGSGLSLCIIPELEGLKRNYEAKMNASKIMADVWREVYGGLMESICKARIYCHPDIRDPLISVLV